MKGIGPVYLITLLYFISGGKYPIYDQFAHFSLMGIEEGSSFDRKKFTEKDLRTEVSTEKDLETFFKSYQENYIKRLKNIFGEQWNHRDTDRALWVYGHLYKSYK